MANNGLELTKDIYLDGDRIHRYGAEGDRDKDEWYWGIQFESGHVYCTYGSWAKGTKFTFKSWNSIDYPEMDHQCKEAHKRYEESEKIAHKEAAEKVVEYWENAKKAKDHPYLKRKKINSHIAKISGDCLTLPIYDIDGNLTSIQKIYPDGKKRFASGGKVQACFATLGDLENSDLLYFAEGFATGASIRQATNKTVVIAFSCHNLVPCAIDIQKKYPHKKLILCQDLGDAGDKSAKQWTELNLGQVLIPHVKPEQGKDFNDIHCFLGLDELKKQLQSKFCNPISIEDFLTSDIKPIEWVLEPYIVKNSINMLFADTGIGKSNFALELCWCLSSLQKFIKWKPTSHYKILYIDGEMDHTEIKAKLDSIALRNKENPLSNSFKLYTSEMVENDGLSPIDLYSPVWRSLLDSKINEADFIVFDNLSCLTGVGDGDDFENKGASWVPIHNWLKPWKHKGKTFLFLHHSNKQGTTRGTSRMNCDLTTILQLKGCPVTEENWNFAFEIHVSKGRHTIGKDKLPIRCELNPMCKWPNKWEFKNVK